MRSRTLALTAVLFALGAAGSAQAATGPAALWHFDGTVTDNSGNGHNGTLSDSGVSWIPGRFGSALAFSGGDVTIPSNPKSPSSLEPPDAISVSAWVEDPTSPGPWKYIVAKSATSGAASYALTTGSAGGIEFYVATDVNSGQYTESPAADQASVWNGQWHLVVGTFDGSGVSLYLDGNLVADSDGSTANADKDTINYLPGANLYIGTNPLCEDPEFAGDIDEVGVWDEALSQADVVALMTGPYEPYGGGASGHGGSGAGGGFGYGGFASSASPGGPALSQLKVSPSRFADKFTGKSGDGKSRSRTREKLGTVISYDDTQSARSLFTVLASESGVRRGKSCVKGHRGKHARGCTRYVTVGNFLHSDRTGSNSFRFSGSVDGHMLAPGKYMLWATPVMGALHGATRTVTFVITG